MNRSIFKNNDSKNNSFLLKSKTRAELENGVEQKQNVLAEYSIPVLQKKK